MNRYLNSLLITSALAVVLGILGYVLISNSFTKPVVKKERIVKIRIVESKSKQTPPPQVKQKSMVEPKQTPIPQPTLKPIIVPKPTPIQIPTPQPIIESKPTPRSVPIVEAKVIPTSQPIVVSKPEPVREAPSSEGELRGFIGGLKSTINAKKKYPNQAIREKIQGSVHLVFDIESDGSASNIRVSGGDVLLRNAAKKSLLESCPMKIPANISGNFPIKDVSTDIIFKLQ